MNVHELRPAFPLPQQLALRFRPLDRDTWLDAQLEDVSQRSISFLSDLPLEIGALVEIALPKAALAQLDPAFHPIQFARVARRVLDRWPDLRTFVTAEFVADPGLRFAGAA